MIFASAIAPLFATSESRWICSWVSSVSRVARKSSDCVFCKYSLNTRKVNSRWPARTVSPGKAWIRDTTPTAGEVTPRSENPGRSATSPGIKTDRQNDCNRAGLATSPRFLRACGLSDNTCGLTAFAAPAPGFSAELANEAFVVAVVGVMIVAVVGVIVIETGHQRWWIPCAATAPPPANANPLTHATSRTMGRERCDTNISLSPVFGQIRSTRTPPRCLLNSRERSATRRATDDQHGQGSRPEPRWLPQRQPRPRLRRPRFKSEGGRLVDRVAGRHRRPVGCPALQQRNSEARSPRWLVHTRQGPRCQPLVWLERPDCRTRHRESNRRRPRPPRARAGTRGHDRTDARALDRAHDRAHDRADDCAYLPNGCAGEPSGRRGHLDSTAHGGRRRGRWTWRSRNAPGNRNRLHEDHSHANHANANRSNANHANHANENRSDAWRNSRPRTNPRGNKTRVPQRRSGSEGWR